MDKIDKEVKALSDKKDKIEVRVVFTNKEVNLFEMLEKIPSTSRADVIRDALFEHLLKIKRGEICSKYIKQEDLLDGKEIKEDNNITLEKLVTVLTERLDNTLKVGASNKDDEEQREYNNESKSDESIKLNENIQLDNREDNKNSKDSKENYDAMLDEIDTEVSVTKDIACSDEELQKIMSSADIDNNTSTLENKTEIINYNYEESNIPNEVVLEFNDDDMPLF